MRTGTAYFGIDTEPVIFETAMRALAEGNSLRSTGRIVAVDKDTVCAWLNQAAQHCRLVMLYLWQNLPISECQLDELWSFVHTKEKHLATAKQICESYGEAWVWVAFAPVCRLVLAFVVGKRTQASADLLLQRVKHVTDDSLPLFTSDQLPEYRSALLQVYGQSYQPLRQGDRGRFPKAYLLPPTDLLYAQVVKHRQNGRLIEVTTKIVFGQPEQIQQRLADSTVSQHINTSFIERDNLTLRQSNRRLTRKTTAFSKELSWLERQLWLSLAYYHLVLPHQSLSQKLPARQPTRSQGSTRRWLPATPAMAAGMTDHIWSTAELLSYRVPIHFIDSLLPLNHLFPPLDPHHQGN